MFIVYVGATTLIEWCSAKSAYICSQCMDEPLKGAPGYGPNINY